MSMTESQKKLLEAVGGKVEDTKPRKEPKIVHIDRTNFDLLDMTYNDTTYYISEENGTITIVKGEY